LPVADQSPSSTGGPIVVGQSHHPLSGQQKTPRPWGERHAHAVPPNFASRRLTISPAANGAIRDPILSPRASRLRQFEGPTPRGFSAVSGDAGLQPATHTLWRFPPPTRPGQRFATIWLYPIISGFKNLSSERSATQQFSLRNTDLTSYATSCGFSKRCTMWMLRG
jgi:hypothetical protein